MNSLSPRERKLVAIGILFVITALIWLALIAPLWSGFAGRATERVRLTDTFARNQRLIASIPRLRGKAELQNIDRARFHIGGTTLAAATEILTERLSAQIAAGGGELRAVQEVSDRPGWVRASAESRMTLPQLVAVLDRLQNDPPYLALNSLTISADRALQSGKLDLMDIRIEVSSPTATPQPR